MKNIPKGKIIFSILLWIGYGIYKNLFYLQSMNQAVINQFDDSWSSQQGLVAYQGVWNYIPIVLILITILVFKKEIKNIIKNLGGKENE